MVVKYFFLVSLSSQFFSPSHTPSFAGTLVVHNDRGSPPPPLQLTGRGRGKELLPFSKETEKSRRLARETIDQWKNTHQLYTMSCIYTRSSGKLIWMTSLQLLICSMQDRISSNRRLPRINAGPGRQLTFKRRGYGQYSK